MSAGLRALWTVRWGPWIFIFKLQQITYILFWGQMGWYIWLQKRKFPPHTGRWPWYLLIVRLPGGGFHLVFSRYYYYVCDRKKNKLSHTSRIVRSVTNPVVKCWIYNIFVWPLSSFWATQTLQSNRFLSLSAICLKWGRMKIPIWLTETCLHTTGFPDMLRCCFMAYWLIWFGPVFYLWPC